MDVLKNYMTYKMFYNVNKKIAEDSTIPKAKGTKSIARYVSLHPHNISQKTEIVVEHFRHHTRLKIGGQANVSVKKTHLVNRVRQDPRYVMFSSDDRCIAWVIFTKEGYM